MVSQTIFDLGPYTRGFHLITEDVLRHIGSLPESGLLHVFMQHTSAGLMINENADPDVRHDLNLYFDQIAPEYITGMRHTLEGPDDMPAHVKSALSGVSLMIPIVRHSLGLGTWQGIYLCEYRNHAPRRKIVAIILA